MRGKGKHSKGIFFQTKRVGVENAKVRGKRETKKHFIRSALLVGMNGLVASKAQRNSDCSVGNRVSIDKGSITRKACRR